MARYGLWRPLAADWASQPVLGTHDLVILHTAAGSMAGTESWFKAGNGRGYTGLESHFLVGGDGEIWQFQDTTRQAEANGNANRRAISIETADRGGPFPNWNLNDANQVPPWTVPQFEALVRLVRWCCDHHGIPKQLVPDSLPSRRGIGYHRLGAPGIRPPGGESWTSVPRKPCPGPRRIAQIPELLRRVKTGGQPQEDDMPSIDDVRKVVREEVAAALKTVATRDDVGWARLQVLTELGHPDPVKAPGKGGRGSKFDLIARGLGEVLAAVHEQPNAELAALTDAIRALADAMRELADRERA